MEKIIRYFINNKSLNYVFLGLIFIFGVNSYVNIPKELFPTIELDKIAIQGSYQGISATNMDKLVVKNIEDNLDTVSGLSKIETTIKAGSFTIITTLSSNTVKSEILNDIKDVLSNSVADIPSDMDMPTATMVKKDKELLNISIGSNIVDKGGLIESANKLKDSILKIKGISSVTMNGDADEEVKIKLKDYVLDALNISAEDVASQVRNLVYLYPIANIKNNASEIFISTVNGKNSLEEWNDTILKINNTNVKLSDIADIKIELEKDERISTYNQKKNISIEVTKTAESNAITLASDIKILVKNFNNPDIELSIYKDSSKPIKERLDTIISNLIMGLILVYMSLHFLINWRIASVVTFGIPFSFMIGIIFIYYMGYSINVISLLGALIVIGIVVDDAVVVAENIQRYIDQGMEAKEAAVKGTMEMFAPITLATVTTFAAFLPIFMLSGEMKLFLMLIPIMVIMILLGSLIESLFFLPLHSAEVLKKSGIDLRWEFLKNKYESLLRILIKYKKSFLITFLIIIPLLTYFVASQTRFQFFPKFDGNSLAITGKVSSNIGINETFSIAKNIEDALLINKKELFIESSSLTVGSRRTATGSNEIGNNMFYYNLELYDLKDQNFLDKYVNPVLNLNFDFNNESKIREQKTFVLSKIIQEKLLEIKNNNLKIEDLQVVETGPGLISSDIQIDLVSNDNELVEQSIIEIEKELNEMNGIKSVSNNIIYGKDEYKLNVNKYAESIGITESILAQKLALVLGERSQAKIFKTNGLMDIKIFNNINEDMDNILKLNVVHDNKTYKLDSLISYIVKKDYEKIEKTNKKIVKSIFANVDADILTATEALKNLEPLIVQLKEKNIEVILEGENEKTQELKGDMSKAIVVALFLMIISLLLIFPKIKYVLMIISVIPFSLLGAFLGHMAVGINLTMPSLIGMLGLAGVVINDGIIMLEFLHGTHKAEEFFYRAKSRLRPILITTITTFLGMIGLMFFATGQAVLLQPIAISLGFGLIWGTVLNLIYLPTLYAVINKINIKGDN